MYNGTSLKIKILYNIVYGWLIRVLNFVDQVRRVQSFVDTLDNLKARNSNPFSNNNNNNNTVSVTTKWEKFGSGVGSLCAPRTMQSSTKVTQDWELFD